VKKRAKVNLLPTDKESHIFKGGGTIQYIPSRLISNDDKGWRKNQHLYITTDDEIKEGDWYLLLEDRIPMTTCNDSIVLENLNKIGAKKIIATTDTSLKVVISDNGKGNAQMWRPVPQPQQSFIESYCKNPVDKVEVEYEWWQDQDNTGAGIENIGEPELILKLTSNNEIIIHPIEEKMYTGEEVIQLFRDYQNAKAKQILDGSEPIIPLEWIKENIK